MRSSLPCVVVAALIGCGTAVPGDTREPEGEPAHGAETSPAAGAPMLLAGGAHTCASFGATLACWGSNDAGELGDGTVEERPVPVPVAPLPGLSALALGTRHACGIAAGRVHCWGANRDGQLGDGTTTDRREPAPVVDLGDQGFVEVAAGDAHSCARNGHGEVFCWGDNQRFAVGTREGRDGDAAASDTGGELVVRPRRVPLPERAARISLEGGHACALLESGAVHCWGAHWLAGWLGHEEARGGLGPTAVPEIAGASSIAAGGELVCAVVSGRVRCHGANLDGQLGDPAADCCARPPVTATVADVQDAVEVVAGFRHACARTGAGAVICWGADRPPAVLPGDEHDERRTSIPSTVIERGAVALAAGERHACARLQDGSVRCWGEDVNGQLGDGISRRVPIATAVDGLADVVRVSAGYVHTCAQERSGRVLCWGAGERRHVAALDGGRGLVAGIYESCTMTAARMLTCTARGEGGIAGDLAGTVAVPFDVAEIAARQGACVRGTDGRVACFEEYSDAHVVRFESPPRRARPITGGRGLAAIAMGGRLCAIRGADVVCWETDAPIQSGAVSHVTGGPIAIALPAGDPPIGVAAGDRDECAWTRSGRAHCWQTFPEVPPHEIAGLEGVEQMVAGAAHVCARTRAGVSCWGDNEHGQVGDGVATFGPREVPVPVAGLPPGVAEITAGAAHSCARTEDGRVFCWGDDEHGRLGRASPPAPRGPVPVHRSP